MKYILRASFVCLLTVAMLAGGFPATASAADNEPVLTSIYHASAIAAVSFAGTTSATLKVPHNHSGTLNLSQGLDVSFNTSVYSLAVPEFPEGSIAVVGGDPVDMVVTYQRKGAATLYTTSYSINVVRAEYIAPSFSGTVTKSVTLSSGLTFTQADFAGKYVKNDGEELGSIAIQGSNPSFGGLKLGSSAYSPGAAITTTDLKNGRLTFAATGSGVVSYIVRAYAVGDTETPVGSVVLTITAEYVPPAFSGTITKTVSLPAGLTLTLPDFSGKYAKNDGGDLSFVSITGSNPSFGKLRLGSSDYSLGSAVSASDLAGGKLTFVATSDGAVSYTVRSYAAGNTTTPVGSAVLQITVEKSSAGDIVYATMEDTAVLFDAYDFDEACDDLTNEDLSYVKFTLPSSSYGKLYYDYVSSSDYGSSVSASTKYYRDSSRYLSRVTFVPKAGYDGTVSIKYTGYNTDGEAYAGAVKVIVKENSGARDILYETNDVTPVTFDTSDFNRVCDDLTGDNLLYVKFKLPSSSYGKLYYDYSSSDYGSSVSASTKYYRDSSRYLSRVTFVPKAGYAGTVSITYTGYNAYGDSYTGNVKIAVRETAGDISYNTTRDNKVTFDSSVFNEACDDVTGGTLSYVKFKLPSSSKGTLYYDYTSSVYTGSKVSSSGKYYRNSSPHLSRVTFVPKAGYTGTVSIGYTGYDIWGESYTGIVKVTVKDFEGSKYFSDVDKSYWWCSEAVDYLYKKGVATGVGGNYYNPVSNISRGDFVLMLCRAFGLEASSSSNFIDVDRSSYYYSAVATARVLGIAQGDGERFRPGSALTRQDAMVLVARALDFAPDITISRGSASDLAAFSDRGQIDEYATDATASLVRAGVVQGTAGKLNPRGNITRAEMAAILYRILTKD